MTVLNNWITHNLHQRFTNPKLDLKINFTPYEFTPMSFHEAADYTAIKIAEKCNKIFLSFSGGADSDYVFHCFQRNNIEFTPIIVKTNFNKIELAYAFHTCRKFKIDPVILELNDKDYLIIYKNEIVDSICSGGIAAIPGIIACRYAKEHNGTLVIGEHMIDNDDTSIWPGVNDWDYYNEIFVGEDNNIPFFNYTVEMAWAMINSIEQLPIAEWKWQTYEIDFRPKIDYNFSNLFEDLRRNISKTRKHNPKTNTNFGSKEDFVNMLLPYVRKR